MSRPRYPVYVISKGRYDNCLTAKFLVRDNVPFHLVVEPQETERYIERFGTDHVLTLPFSNLGKGSYPARNWVWDHSVEMGADRHWILDDNIRETRRLYAGERIPCDSGVALRTVEDFTDRYENVAISGMNYQMFVTPTSMPFATNVHVYSNLLIRNDLHYRWRLRYNEDTDLCLQVLADGFSTVLVSAFMVDKQRTMTMKGGNSDELYQEDGRLRMARSLEELWPGVVKTAWRFGRPQHVVDWGRFKNDLELKPEVRLDDFPAIEEYGVELKEIKPVESELLISLVRRFQEDNKRDAVEGV
jgi:hypothetical protein